MAKKKTQEEFEREVYDLVGNEYAVIGKYTRTRDKILMKHNICGNEWSVKANNFLTGNSRCYYCDNQKRIKTTDMFKEEINKKYNNNISVIGEYTGHAENIKIKCNVHDFYFYNTPINMLSKRRKNVCPQCIIENVKESQRKKIDVVQEQLECFHKGKISLIGDYVNTHTKTSFQCNECKCVFKAEPNHVLRLSGCPECNTKSNGEDIIVGFLKDECIVYEFQKSFEDCRYINTLKFDFYIPDYGENGLLIEYDGKQHYEPIEYFGGLEAFKKQQIKDDIKNKYAKDNNIEIIRIPYTIAGIKLINYLEDLKDKYLLGSKAEKNTVRI